jgi:hypothetical protein
MGGTAQPSYVPRPTSQPAAPFTLTGEYDEMIKLLNLNDTQKKYVVTAAKNESNALAAYDQTNKKQLDDLNKNLDTFNKRLADPNHFNADANNARAIIQANIARIAAKRQDISHRFKIIAANTLTPEQKTTWIGIKLSRIVAEDFALLNLSADQAAAVKDICDRQAQTATNVDVAADKDLQAAVRQQVVASVLTDDQKLRYAQIVAERQAKNPS